VACLVVGVKVAGAKAKVSNVLAYLKGEELF
jgi:hypothetical protein